MKKTTRAALVLVVLAALGGLAVLVDLLNHGLSTRRQPRAPEVFLARRLRHLAIPRGARDLRNPVPASPEIVNEAMAHFADHCASCHGNDGKGQTEIGKNLYPKAPDMTTLDTQRISDGELFYIIKNGVRFTGMPAWGDDSPESDRDSWKLVHFIRHLPKITETELSEMETMNPVSPAELKEREEEARFLEGKKDSPPAIPQSAGHKH
ncbi:MAG: c-type cytochrome [Thermoanaerobaculia bacterium]